MLNHKESSRLDGCGGKIAIIEIESFEASNEQIQNLKDLNDGLSLSKEQVMNLPCSESVSEVIVDSQEDVQLLKEITKEIGNDLQSLFRRGDVHFLSLFVLPSNNNIKIKSIMVRYGLISHHEIDKNYRLCVSFSQN